MNNYKVMFFTLCLLTKIQYTNAQIEEGAGQYIDAVNYSFNGISGPARILGLGGAGSTLGANLGSVSSNPAGLGLYRKSELTGSLGINFGNTSSQFLNNTTLDNRQSFYLPNFAIAFNGMKDDLVDDAYRGGTFSISFNRINNFNNQFSYSGMNSNNSFTDVLAEKNEGYGVSSFGSSDEILDYAALGYYARLIVDVGPTSWESAIRSKYSDGTEYSGYPIRQQESVVAKGGQNQWDFAYGGNVQDKFYFGFGLGVGRINHSIDKSYKETPTNDNPISNFTFKDYLSVRGTGINLKFGFIVKPIDALRFGLSLQSPTYYSIKNEYKYTVNTLETSGNFSTYSTVPGSYSYNLTTPARFKGGLTYLFGKRGFITGDIEFVDYSTASLSTNSLDQSADYSPDNRTIKNIMRSTFNANIGTEFRFDVYRLRTGFGLIQDPFTKSSLNKVDDVNRSIYNFSLGGGVNWGDYYLDAAIVHSFYNSSYRPYSLFGYEPTAVVRNKNTGVNVTFGAYF